MCTLKNILAAFLFLSIFSVSAQDYSISGNLFDSKSNEPLIGANVLLENKSDQKVWGATTAVDGSFEIKNVPDGDYVIKLSFIGYKLYEQDLTVSGNQNLGALKLEEDKELLDEVEVVEIQDRVQQLGDTTQYNADAFKVNPDASAQDLIAKMPGVVVQNGEVQAQGEQVKKVLVDGKEFFSTDPTLALQSLPAEIIDKIQVYDEKSEQSQFTGFDDGNTQKTINILTKAGKNNGHFGKGYVGYGTDNRYNGGFNYNYFNGDQRVSLLGNFNNINLQNFSTEDILGAVGNTSGRRGGFRGGGGGADDFLVGQQTGIVTTNAFGVNYSDEWGKKFKVSSNYFFNQTKNNSQSITNREYYTDAIGGQTYAQNDSSHSNNLNHRFNMRMEYEIDENNSLLFRPSLSVQDYTSYSLLDGATFNEGQLLNSTTSLTESNQIGYKLAGDLLYRHKFKKKRRTLSLSLGSDYDSKDGLSTTASENFFSDTISSSSYNLRQQSDLYTTSTSYNASLRFTEPVGKAGMLLMDYSPSVTYSNSDKRTYSYDSISGGYDFLQDNLSNVFSSSYTKQEVGAGYMLRQKGSNLMFRLNFQNAELVSDQTYPQEYDLTRSFNTFLPMAMYRKKISDTSNIRIFYRSASTAPTVSQLQDVVDNSNTLQLTGGNSGLDQEVRHFVVGNYALNTPKKSRTFFVFGLAEYKQDYIGTSTFIADADTSINGYPLAAGSQYSTPENMDGYFNAKTTLTYGFPVTKLKSNLNLSGGGGYTNAPGLINNITNNARTTNVNGGAVLGSNISEKVDFTVSYNASYNFVDNTLATVTDNNYFNQTTSFKFNWLLGNGFVFNTDLTNTYYSGLSEGIDQSYWLWNAYIGYKFMKKDAAEIKLSAFDILGQNTSISRTISETYLEDVETTVLQQYVMLTFTYTLRAFDGPKISDEEKRRHDMMGPPPPPGRG